MNIEKKKNETSIEHLKNIFNYLCRKKKRKLKKNVQKFFFFLNYPIIFVFVPIVKDLSLQQKRIEVIQQ